MAIYFTTADAEKISRGSGRTNLREASESLASSSFKLYTGKKYDIFLSHSYFDKEKIWKLHKSFNNLGFKPYVDWIDDNLNANEREPGDPEVARTLKDRMGKSRCLFYATSSYADESRWMPWELGYADSKINKVAVFPYLDENQVFKKYGFLNLYPIVTFDSRKEIFHVDNTPLTEWIKS